MKIQEDFFQGVGSSHWDGVRDGDMIMDPKESDGYVFTGKNG